jgi:hypothetical protein
MVKNRRKEVPKREQTQQQPADNRNANNNECDERNFFKL